MANKEHQKAKWWAVIDQDHKLIKRTIAPSQRDAFDKFIAWKGIDTARKLKIEGWKFCRVLIQVME